MIELPWPVFATLVGTLGFLVGFIVGGVLVANVRTSKDREPT